LNYGLLNKTSYTTLSKKTLNKWGIDKSSLTQPMDIIFRIDDEREREKKKEEKR
jgi:hypothetical protein